jgi:putative pyruvate formate lyase activating enzyme
VECGEEIELIPSHLLYLSGCNLRCAFCIGQSDAFDPQRGQLLTAALLSEIIARRRQQGARNIQWVGGEPTIHLPAILEAMAGSSDLPPVVWKSNFFGTPEAFVLLEGVVDVYVADLKFGNDPCARRIAGVDGYFEIVTRNLLLAASQTRLIVRHLLLPGHFDCCYRPIVEWMSRCLPATPLRVMAGYLPYWQAARYKELGVPLDREYGFRACSLAAEKGLNLIS